MIPLGVAELFVNFIDDPECEIGIVLTHGHRNTKGAIQEVNNWLFSKGYSLTYEYHNNKVIIRNGKLSKLYFINAENPQLAMDKMKSLHIDMVIGSEKDTNPQLWNFAVSRIRPKPSHKFNVFKFVNYWKNRIVSQFKVIFGGLWYGGL